MGTRNILTIQDYHNGGGDLVFDVGEGFMLQLSGTKDTVKSARLTITRKPDKHSTRLGMFAYLRTQPGYQSLGFPYIYLTRDTYSDDGKFVSRVVYIFPNVTVDSILMRGDREEITFICGGFSEMSISKVGVTFKSTP